MDDDPFGVDSIAVGIGVHPGESASHVFDVGGILHGRRKPVVGGSNSPSQPRQNADQNLQFRRDFIPHSPASAVHIKDQREVVPALRKVEVQSVECRIGTRAVVILDVLDDPHGRRGKPGNGSGTPFGPDRTKISDKRTIADLFHKTNQSGAQEILHINDRCVAADIAHGDPSADVRHDIQMGSCGDLDQVGRQPPVQKQAVKGLGLFCKADVIVLGKGDQKRRGAGVGSCNLQRRRRVTLPFSIPSKGLFPGVRADSQVVAVGHIIEATDGHDSLDILR